MERFLSDRRIGTYFEDSRTLHGVCFKTGRKVRGNEDLLIIYYISNPPNSVYTMDVWKGFDQLSIRTLTTGFSFPERNGVRCLLSSAELANVERQSSQKGVKMFYHSCGDEGEIYYGY